MEDRRARSQAEANEEQHKLKLHQKPPRLQNEQKPAGGSNSKQPIFFTCFVLLNLTKMEKSLKNGSFPARVVGDWQDCYPLYDLHMVN